MTAAAVATIDELSGGRAFVGLGAGGGFTLDPLGIDRRRPVVTVRHMVSALRDLFAGKTVDLDGEVFSLKSASLDFGRSSIEVILAGRGPRMVALGGEVADGFNLSYIHKDLLGGHVSTLRSAARRHNRRFLITYSTMLVTSEEEFREARSSLSFRLVDSPIGVRELIGMTEAEANGIREALAEGGAAAGADLVREEWVGPVHDCRFARKRPVPSSVIYSLDKGLTNSNSQCRGQRGQPRSLNGRRPWWPTAERSPYLR